MCRVFFCDVGGGIYGGAKREGEGSDGMGDRGANWGSGSVCNSVGNPSPSFLAESDDKRPRRTYTIYHGLFGIYVRTQHDVPVFLPPRRNGIRGASAAILYDSFRTPAANPHDIRRDALLIPWPTNPIHQATPRPVMPNQLRNHNSRTPLKAPTLVTNPPATSGGFQQRGRWTYADRAW